MSDEKTSNANLESAKAHAKEAAEAAKSHLKGAVDSSKEHLKHAAGDLRAAAEAKARELREAAEAKAREFRETAETHAREFRGRAEHAYGDTAERVRTFQEDSEAYIRENPLKAVLTAAAAGFVLGMLFRR
jgi:ElaB/YqjD/DUF883 family membrane-anchored ribosome-binding protein